MANLNWKQNEMNKRSNQSKQRIGGAAKSNNARPMKSVQRKKISKRRNENLISRNSSTLDMPEIRPASEQKYEKIGLFSNGYIDLPFFFTVMILLVLGLIMLFSASYAYAYYYEDSSLYFIKRQFIFAMIGIVGMLILAKMDYRVLRVFVYPIFIVGILCLIAVFFMPAYNGEFHRWIYIGPIHFQPSEVVKFSVIIMFSHLIAKNYSKMNKFRYGILPFFLILGVIAILMMLQPHLSGTILILIIGLSLMIIGGCNLKFFAAAGSVGIAGILVFLFGFNGISYVETRLQGWLDKDFDPLGVRWQVNQSLYALGSGGFLGSGLGNSKQKYLYVSEPQNDFIFAIVGEELGFVGAVIIIMLFMYLVWRGFKIALRCPDRFGSLVAMGISIQVGAQAALDIAVVTDSIPNTGISLPFFSYGGTALMMLLLEMGVVLSISKRSSVRQT